MIFRYIINYATLLIVMIFIVLPIALVAGALMGIGTAVVTIYASINESIKKLLEVCDGDIEHAKIKRLLTKVIKKNTIDI